VGVRLRNALTIRQSSRENSPSHTRDSIWR
jgi:hypothetical protein